MKKLIWTSLLALGVLAYGTEKPNILLVIVDDMGWKDLGCTGSTYHETPVIDALADEGIRFETAYSASVICSPSRAAILTGKHPARTKLTCVFNGEASPDDRLYESSKGLSGVNQNKEALHRHALGKDEVLLSETLQDAGYATAWFGKWHMGAHANFTPDKRGFQVAKGHRIQHVPTATSGHWGKTFKHYGGQLQDMKDDEYLADRLTDECIDFIRGHHEKPFFAVLSHYLVHHPMAPKAELLERFKNKKAVGDQANPAYAAMVASVDESVGRVLTALDELGERENTLIVITSDNGAVVPKVTSTYPLLGHKALMFEGGIRVPMIMNWPARIKGGRVVEGRVVGTDLYPTFMAAAGLPLHPTRPMDGLNLLPVLEGKAHVAERPLTFHYPHYTKYIGPASSIIAGEWKLMRFYNDEQGKYFLFNLDQDPGEQKDLSAEYPEIVQRLARQLDKTLTAMDAEMPSPNPNYDPSGKKNSNRMTMYRKASQFRAVSEKKLILQREE